MNQSFELTVDIIVAIIELVMTITIGIIQTCLAKKQNKFEKRQDERDERRRKDTVYSEATKFIQKYNNKCYKSEIYLLPLCVSAYKYNSTYTYCREIYRDFCQLTEEVQNEVLKRQGIELFSCKDKEYYKNVINKINIVFKNNGFQNNDILYENGKNLENILLHHLRNNDVPQNIEDIKDFILSSFEKEKHFPSQILNSIGDEFPKVEEDILNFLVFYELILKFCNSDSLNKQFTDFLGQKYMEDLFLETLYFIENYKQKED